MTRLALLAPALLLLLAGCEDKAAGPAEQGGEASGEVLEGSVSDAMIPLDQLTSEAPLAPPRAQEGTAIGLDAEQPEVTPAEGIETVPAEAAPAAPAPQAPPVG